MVLERFRIHEGIPLQKEHVQKFLLWYGETTGRKLTLPEDFEYSGLFVLQLGPNGLKLEARVIGHVPPPDISANTAQQCDYGIESVKSNHE
jgi:hypothetical protein